MKNKIVIFKHEEFGEIRTLNIDGEPWFVGKEIAEKLGYSNSRKALADHVKDNHKNTVTIRDGITRGNPNQVIIDEAGFYSLVLRSKLPQAEQFQEWVTSEVLPAIRKHKMYLTPETAKEAIEEPSVFLAKAMLVANNVIDQQKAKLEAQAHQINQLKPKAKIYDKYMNAEDSYTITDVAVMNGVRPTDLFSFLKRINWLTKQAQCAYELTKEAPKEYFKVIRCFYGGCSRKTQIRVTATGFNAISSLIETAL